MNYKIRFFNGFFEIKKDFPLKKCKFRFSKSKEIMYKPTIGLEIHTELKTKTKMFCGCLNNPDEKMPNKNICPVCLAHPGTLPTINKKAVESVLKIGLALNSEIPKISKFDRKNYFYPDIPKGYQISQYDQPLILGGELNGIKLRRIHLEEDTARLVHSTQSYSLVDFNRAGIPLMELVTEPEIKNGEQAVAFAKELQLVLRYLQISDADMEKGHMRIEANISVSKDSELGTKVEVKNLNSFKAVGEAIDYEIKRQSEILDKGERVHHETRGWDDAGKKTVHQRAKEEAHDYRYFPEPDLPPLDTAKFYIDELKSSVPELPKQKRERFSKEYGFNLSQLEMLIADQNLAQYFENSILKLFSKITAYGENKTKSVQLLYNYLATDIKGLMAEENIESIEKINIAPENFADLIVLLIKGEISSRIAKDLLEEMSKSGASPAEIIKEKELSQVSDDSIIINAAKEIISENLKAVQDYKKGQENALQFLIGKTMAKLKGRGNPEKIKNILRNELQ